MKTDVLEVAREVFKTEAQLNLNDVQFNDIEKALKAIKNKRNEQ